MFFDGTVNSMPLSAPNTEGAETRNASSQIIDNLLAASTDTLWNGADGEDFLERKDTSQEEEMNASEWILDEPFYEFFS